jgi:predicted metal-binding membrane protein
MTTDGHAPAFAATRAQRGLVALLAALTALAWWRTADAMRGMDDGPWTSLGGLGWFLGIWVVMMGAMMVPSAIPTVALYARTARTRSPLPPVVFTSAYLAVWAATGLAACTAAAAGGRVAGGVLAWDRAGRWAAGVTLLAAAAYQLTPLKDACLGRCRNPLVFLLGSWRPGLLGALRLGAESGAWCAGCCWALMVSLFALGVMSVAWMAFVAVLVALEKALPWRRTASWGTAAILLALGVLLLAAPQAVPALTLPGGHPMPPGGMGS